MGKQVLAPLGAESACDLAVGGRWSEVALAAVVVGADVGVIKKREQVAPTLPFQPGNGRPSRCMGGSAIIASRSSSSR
jgi:hypothetical protein